MNSAYVDPDTTREALENYYRASAHRKDAFLVGCLERLHTLLHDDVFNLGVLPTEHLRAVDFHLMQGHFERDTPARINEAMLSTAFTQLTKGVLRKKDFKLRIAIIQTEIRLKQWQLLFAFWSLCTMPFERKERKSVYLGLTQGRTDIQRRLGVYPLDEIIRVWTPYLDWEEKAIEFLDGENWKRKYHNEDEDEEEEEHVSYPYDSDSDGFS
ncbi:hypothetical protein J4E91_006132 [Alternaria rosae]|nr:hypothetical protein J4E91_006132 [Alternaria rosae]